MTSSKPYLLRALYEWIINNNCIPQILVDVSVEGVAVPQQFVQNGHIVLNISPTAVRKLIMNNEFIEFDARFDGMVRHICVPVEAVRSIYSRETEQGMMFGPEFDQFDQGDYQNDPDSGDHQVDSAPQKQVKTQAPTKRPKGKPHLKIVK